MSSEGGLKLNHRHEEKLRLPLDLKQEDATRHLIHHPSPPCCRGATARR